MNINQAIWEYIQQQSIDNNIDISTDFIKRYSAEFLHTKTAFGFEVSCSMFGTEENYQLLKELGTDDDMIFVMWDVSKEEWDASLDHSGRRWVDSPNKITF